LVATFDRHWEIIMTDATQSEKLLRRRDVVKTALLGVVAIPVASLCMRPVNAAAPANALDEKDPQAKALGYVQDAAKVDVKTNPTFKPGQSCVNCLQLTGKAGDAFRPCNLFPGKLVNTNGWCKAWVKKS
jgi:hypothetical protein